MEQDFIEIEIDKSRLSFEFVLSTICRELNINPSIVHKLRKLPNTIIRKDKDVRRFVDFQELELVLTNRASSEASRNYGPSVSPRHVDVVYWIVICVLPHTFPNTTLSSNHSLFHVKRFWIFCILYWCLLMWFCWYRNMPSPWFCPHAISIAAFPTPVWKSWQDQGSFCYLLMVC